MLRLYIVCRYNMNLEEGPVHISWFEGAETNACYNCLDRHVQAGLGDRVAFYWEGNDEGEVSDPEGRCDAACSAL